MGVSALFGDFLLVPKHQSVAELVDDDRFLPIHLVGENLTREVVEHQVLDGTLDRTGTEVGVVALASQILKTLCLRKSS